MLQWAVEDMESNIKLHLFDVLAAGFRTAKAGAATSINCAVNPELNTQQCFYYADCKPSVSIPLSRLVWYEVRITSGKVSPSGMCNTSWYLAQMNGYNFSWLALQLYMMHAHNT